MSGTSEHRREVEQVSGPAGPLPIGEDQFLLPGCGTGALGCASFAGPWLASFLAFSVGASHGSDSYLLLFAYGALVLAAVPLLALGLVGGRFASLGAVYLGVSAVVFAAIWLWA